MRVIPIPNSIPNPDPIPNPNPNPNNPNLYHQVLLDHLLRLRDEPLLQRLYLLQHLVRARVSPLELAPPVGVVRVLELLRERLDLVSIKG